MRRLHTLGLLVCGLLGSLAVSSCSDEPSGPGVSDDTAWRVACERRGGACSLGYDPHGGAEIAGDIKATCRQESGGLSITLEDPGTESGAMKGRNRSILEVNFIDVEDSECTVLVTEYVRSASGAPLLFKDQCDGNPTAGSCIVTGERNKDGYDFNGSIFCNAMQRNNAGDRDFRLEDAKNPNEPVPLKIVNCK
jgi:hypothetical protein